MKRTFLAIMALLVSIGGQSIAAPNLFVNGSLVQQPMASEHSDFSLMLNGQIEFTLLTERSDFSNRNSLFLNNWGSSDVSQTIFAAGDAAGTTRTFDLDGRFAMSMLSDANSNGRFSTSDGDRWLSSEREFNRASQVPDLGYQSFRAYRTPTTNANYSFGNGDLKFLGNYDFLIFIDDPHEAGRTFDHNDMVVAARFVKERENPESVPEPSALVLLGAGLTAIGAVRLRFWR